MRLFALTIFLSSLLVFQVQPMLGKYLLPWFGGTPAVWTVCLLFFQATLLAGYTYAHLLARFISPKRQVFWHAALLGLSLLWLPVTPPESLKPDETVAPGLWVLLVLAASVGGPFLLVSSTAPLVQHWFSIRFPNRSPYRLYALSNLGSLLGLFAYPFLVERLLPLDGQTWGWSWLYLFYAVFGLACGWQVRRGAAAKVAAAETEFEALGQEREFKGAKGKRLPTGRSTPVGVEEEDLAAPLERPRVSQLLFWLSLSACGSTVLLSVTNQMSFDVPAVPFNWVLPLGLYLVTFILCFEHDRWYKREVFALAWLGALVLGLWLLLSPAENLIIHVAGYSAVLFISCMVCHGELARLRPAPKQLTEYFLVISLGGALGGLFVSLIAARIFDQYHEYTLSLFGTGGLLIAAMRWEQWRDLSVASRGRRLVILFGTLGLMAAVIVAASGTARRLQSGPGELTFIAQDRNFYGIVRTNEVAGMVPGTKIRTFIHGNTVHGFQFQSPARRELSTGYYEPRSGVGLALRHHPKREAGEPLRVGLIGLGVGTLAALGQPGDEMVFYEIDPEVEHYAREYFTFLEDAEARGVGVEVHLGDARVVLERQLAAGERIPFDVLVLDAFSSDAVPAHLLTEEAFILYRRWLEPDGILAAHVTNRYLNLVPVMRGGASAVSLHSRRFLHQTIDEHLPTRLRFHSQWVLATPDPGFFQRPEVANALIASGRIPGLPPETTEILWTDQHSSLFEVLR